MFHRVHLHTKGGCVTQCRPETHTENANPATENNYYPKVLPSMQSGEGQPDPITKRSRAKGTDGSGNGSGHRQAYIPEHSSKPPI